jgi:hypothetical protein
MKHIIIVIAFLLAALGAGIIPIQYYYANKHISRMPEYNSLKSALEIIVREIQSKSEEAHCSGNIIPLTMVKGPDDTLPNLLTDLNLSLSSFDGWKLRVDTETYRQIISRKEENLKKWGGFWGSIEIERAVGDIGETIKDTHYSASAKWAYSSDAEVNNAQIFLEVNDERTSLNAFKVAVPFSHPRKLAAIKGEISREKEALENLHKKSDIWIKVLLGIGGSFVIYVLSVCTLVHHSKKRQILMSEKLVQDIEQFQELFEDGHYVTALELVESYLTYFPDDMKIRATRERLLDFTNNDPKKAQLAYVEAKKLGKLIASASQNPQQALLTNVEKIEIRALLPYHPELAESFQSYSELEERAERSRKIAPQLDIIDGLLQTAELQKAKEQIGPLLQKHADIIDIQSINSEIEKNLQKVSIGLEELNTLIVSGHLQNFAQRLEELKKIAVDEPHIQNYINALKKSEGIESISLQPLDSNSSSISIISQTTAIIGRQDKDWKPDIAIADRHRPVSRKHLQLSLLDGKVMVEDLGSENGTFVNGERVTIGEISDGDIVTLAKVIDFTASLLRNDRGNINAVLVADSDQDYVLLADSLEFGMDNDRINIKRTDFKLLKWNGRLFITNKTQGWFLFPELQLQLGEYIYTCKRDSGE